MGKFHSKNVFFKLFNTPFNHKNVLSMPINIVRKSANIMTHSILFCTNSASFIRLKLLKLWKILLWEICLVQVKTTYRLLMTEKVIFGHNVNPATPCYLQSIHLECSQLFQIHQSKHKNKIFKQVHYNLLTIVI